MDHKGLMNEPSSKIDDLYRRNPRQPTERDYLWADTDIDWCRVANDRAAMIIRQTQELEQYGHELGEALIQRDLWSVLAFVVGVGLGFLVGCLVVG